MLGIATWNYLRGGLKVAGHFVIQPLYRYVRKRFRPSLPRAAETRFLPLLPESYPLASEYQYLSCCQSDRRPALSFVGRGTERQQAAN
jgi:hypothetical protein